MKAVPPIETAVQTVARMGLKPGDILVSKFWDGVPLQIEEVREKEIRVLRLHQTTPGVWRPGARHPMKYLPSDVAKREGT
jgi:hypothetical protein